MKKNLIVIMSIFMILMNFYYLDIAFAKNDNKTHQPPPWANNDKNKHSPPAAPEPITLSLIAMGASGLTGYFIGRKKSEKKAGKA
jgi:hypothetical protein